MSWFGGSPQVGDWVVTTRPIKTTLTDVLLGSDAGVRPGSRGVVTGSRGWNAVEVQLDGGLFGRTTVRARPDQLRVVRRGGGVDAFAARRSHLNAARTGVAFALAAPLLWFAGLWFLHGGSKDGLVAALVEGLIYGALDAFMYALSNPLHALLYFVVVSWASRFAFRG